MIAWAFVAIPLGAPGVWQRTSWVDIAIYLAGATVAAVAAFKVMKRSVDRSLD